LGDDALAEDCVAETFSRFLKSLKSGHGPNDHLQAYLYRIAHNWITDVYRREPIPPMDLDEIHQLADPEQSERTWDKKFEEHRIRAMLSNLSPDQRLVITLRFIEDMEMDEIVKIVGKPAGAVRALQFRAMKALRKAFPEE
jgi:RNA polymerase sigma-70 factor (ECF subfamily)